jgi:uncharacterized protein YdeI (YjbR/CyaY-like superfamily)
MSKLMHKDLEVYSFQTKDIFYDWLGKNYSQDKGFWLRYYKVATKKPTVSYTDSVDVALCWGWIDGLTNRYDEESYLVRFTPRRPKSVWSKINVGKVERLIADKLMQPSGLIHIESAKSDGRWDAAYSGQSAMEVPKEFIDQISKDPEVFKFYDSMSKANKYAIAFRIETVVGQEC